jgi:hypothetical protein
MNKSTANAIVDSVAFVALLLLAATGVLMRYVLPPGSGHFSTLWGMDRHQWGDVHFWIAVSLLGVLTLHLALHWRWIASIVAGRQREGSGVRVAIAVAALLLLAGLVATPFFVPVEATQDEPPHRIRSGQAPHADADRTGQAPKPADDQIAGSMTLLEVERLTGVPAATIVKELGLPGDVPTDERLGRLRRKYGFEIHAVREIVEKHSKEQRQHD